MGSNRRVRGEREGKVETGQVHPSSRNRKGFNINLFLFTLLHLTSKMMFPNGEHSLSLIL